MTLIASLLTFVLGIAAMTHFHWASGGHWPAGNEKQLARAAVGLRDIDRMPPRASSAAVGVGLTVAALLPQMLVGGTLSGLLPDVAVRGLTWLVVAVFALRGIAGYTPPWRARFCAEPFASLDRRYYSPLCLAAAAGFLLLVL